MDGIVTSFRSAFAVAVVLALVCATPVTADGVPTASSRGPQCEKRASALGASVSYAGRGGKAAAAPAFVGTVNAVAGMERISPGREGWTNLEIPSSQPANHGPGSPRLAKRTSSLTSALSRARRLGEAVAAPAFVSTVNAAASTARNSRGAESWTNLQIPSSQPANHGLRKRSVFGAANAAFTAGSRASIQGAVGGLFRGAGNGVRDVAKMHFDSFRRLIGVPPPPPPPPTLLQKVFAKSGLETIVNTARSGAAAGAVRGFAKGAAAKVVSGGAPAASVAGKAGSLSAGNAALIGTGTALATAGTVVVVDSLIDIAAEPVRQP